MRVGKENYEEGMKDEIDEEGGRGTRKDTKIQGVLAVDEMKGKKRRQGGCRQRFRVKRKGNVKFFLIYLLRGKKRLNIYHSWQNATRVK